MTYRVLSVMQGNSNLIEDPCDVSYLVTAKTDPGKKDVPIVFCADTHYGTYLPVVVQSILEHASSDYHYQIIVFDCGIKDEVLDALTRQIQGAANFSFSVRRINLFIEHHHFAGYRYITPAAYGRFAIPQLCAQYDKVIYADIDMIFDCDPAELIELDLKDNYIGAVMEFSAEADRVYQPEDSQIDFKLIGLGEDQPYINSGFLLFNIKQWREHNLFAQCLDYFARHKGQQLLVQNTINAICRGKICYLSPIWNFSIWDKDAIKRWRERKPQGLTTHLEEFAKVYEASLADSHIIVHFLGTEKPWQNRKIFFADLWWRYALFVERKFMILPEAETMGKKIVPIVFCADANYGFYLPVVIRSILDNSNRTDFYDIIIMDCGIRSEILEIVAEQCAEYGCAYGRGYGKES